MRKSVLVLLLVPNLLASSAGADEPVRWLYFNDLATRSLSGDGSAFREVLAKAETVLPGEQLEELAEISSKYIFVDPVDFLDAQSAHAGCFGVDFMGTAYVDNFDTHVEENAARYRTLNAISDPALENTKQLCLAVLDGP